MKAFDWARTVAWTAVVRRYRAIQWPKASQWLLAGSLYFLGLAFAWFLGFGAWMPVAGLLGLAIFGGLIALGLTDISQRQLKWLLVAVLAVTLLHPIGERAAHAPIGYLFELLCFTLLVGAAVSAKRRYQDSLSFQVLALLTLVFFAFGLLSSALGLSRFMAGLWQLQYNLKLPAMFLIGMLLSFDWNQERWFMRFVGWAWVPIGAFVALEFVAPGFYTSLMSQPIDHTPNPLLGLGVRRAGPFPHSGYLALTVAMLSWASLVYGWLRKEKRWLLPGLASFALLLLSGQRQETLAFLLAAAMLLLFVMRKHWRMLVVLAAFLLPIAALVTVIFDLPIAQRLLSEWGAGTALEQVSERYVLTETGIQIAKEWAPLGSGLGTYGGAGAQKFDQSQFLAYGFDKYWWFRQGMFLVDVYWPSVAAESGFIGATAWAAALTLLFLVLLRHLWLAGTEVPLVWLACGAMLLLLANSPTSAALTDPRISFWMWLPIGAAAARAFAFEVEARRGAATRASSLAQRTALTRRTDAAPR